MSLVGEKVLLRIYLQSADRSPHTPSWQRIVKSARAEGLAGATVLRGIMGSGGRGVIAAGAWSIVEHVPVIVEIVDEAQRISAFVEGPLEDHWLGGLLTLERAHVMMYRPRTEGSANSMRLGGANVPLSTLPAVKAKAPMQIKEDGVLLRVFIGESDRFESRPLYEAIVQKVRELGLAGATVLRGAEGFGANSVVHKAALLEMSTDLPILIEIVDSEPQIQRLLPDLQDMVKEGMITMERVMIVMYRHDEKEGMG